MERALGTSMVFREMGSGEQTGQTERRGSKLEIVLEFTHYQAALVWAGTTHHSADRRRPGVGGRECATRTLAMRVGSKTGGAQSAALG